MFKNDSYLFKAWYFVLAMGAIIGCMAVFPNLDKGFVFNDEAYYLFHYRNQGESLRFDRTNFYRIFKFLYTPNIKVFRLISITSVIISNCVLTFLLIKYLKIKQNAILLSLIGVIFCLLIWNGVNSIIQQYMGNTILVNVGLSLFLMGRLVRKDVFTILAGFVFAFIFFDGNSHVVTLIPITIFVACSPFSAWKKNLLHLFLGTLLGIFFYFIFLDSISNFIYQLTFLKEYLSFHTKQHSKMFMVMWVIYLLLNGIVPVVFGYLFLRINKFNPWSRKIIEGTITILFLISIITLHINFEYSIILLIVLVHVMALETVTKESISLEKKLIFGLLLFIPYGLAFGSQTFFIYRITAYFIYYGLIMLLFALDGNKIVKMLFLFFIVSISLIVPSFLKDGKGWKGFNYKDQTEVVKVNGYSLLLDKDRKKDIEQLSPFLYKQPNVIYSTNHLLGYLYITEATPPIYYYFGLKDYLKFIIDKRKTNPDEYIYIESDDHPFTSKEFLPLEFVNYPEKYQVVKVGRFTLYLPANYKQN